MTDPDDIPVLDDLIEKGIEITLSDLGLEDEPSLAVEDVMVAELEINADDAAPLAFDPTPAEAPSAAPYALDSFAAETSRADRYSAELAGSDLLADNPALEQAVRRILDEHMELAWQEIRLAIQQHLDRS